jgi:hypothetical protein
MVDLIVESCKWALFFDLIEFFKNKIPANPNIMIGWDIKK